MTEIPARCDSCASLSRVPIVAVGKFAICPACRREFLVTMPQVKTPPKEIPTVYPVRAAAEVSMGVLYGLALSAFLVPLAWLLGIAIGFKPPVVTLGVPLALAIAASGLGFGVALVKHWSVATRVKGIVMLLLLAWGLGATFYFLQADWIEAARRNIGVPMGPWREFTPPGGPCKIEMPGHPRKDDTELIRGWSLDTFKFADKNDAWFGFAIAHGKPDAANVDAFFKDAKDGAMAATNGTLVEETSITLQKQPGREYVFKLNNNANRIVRVYLVGTKAVVAMAEGPFLPHDARDVQHFFNSLYLQVGK